MAPPASAHTRTTRRICEAIKGRIASGLLGPGARLPSTRSLAAEWGVSRTTVTAAYEQLIAEGYVETRQGARTRVALGLGPAPAPSGRPAPPEVPDRLSAYGRRVAGFDLPPVLDGASTVADFRYGDLAAADFPVLGWRKAVGAALLRRRARRWDARGEQRAPTADRARGSRRQPSPRSGSSRPCSRRRARAAAGTPPPAARRPTAGREPRRRGPPRWCRRGAEPPRHPRPGALPGLQVSFRDQLLVGGRHRRPRDAPLRRQRPGGRKPGAGAEQARGDLALDRLADPPGDPRRRGCFRCHGNELAQCLSRKLDIPCGPVLGHGPGRSRSHADVCPARLP